MLRLAPLLSRPAFASLAALLLALGGCGDDGGDLAGIGGGVPAIAVSLSEPSVTVAQGAAGTLSVTVTRAGGYEGTVDLTVEGVPAGVTASVSPATLTGGAGGSPVTPSGTLTLLVDGSAALGTYQVTVRARGQEVTERTARVSLTVAASQGPAFALALVPGALSVPGSATGSAQVVVARGGGFTSPVALTVSGIPQGVTATVTPSTATGGTATLAVAVAAGVTTGQYLLTVTGQAEGLPAQTATLALTVADVPAGTYVIRVPATPVVVPRGGSVAVTIQIVRNAFDTPVALTARTPEATVGFTTLVEPPTTSGNTVTLTISAEADIALGTYTFAIVGDALGVPTQSVPLTVQVVEASGSGGGGMVVAY